MDKTFENWLVVSDIDGTLNDKFRRPVQRNQEAIKKFTELGGNFTLASGRLQSSLERNYNRTSANQPAVVLNGAGIYEYNKREMIWRNTIGEKGREFVKYISTEFDDIFKSVDIGVYFDDHVYVVKSGLFQKITTSVDKSSHEYVSSIDDVPAEGWMKVIFWSNPFTIAKLNNLIKKMENPDANFMLSSIMTLEMLQKDTHKGVGIMRLADMLGIEKSHVAAIGDYYNDWDMLKTVGLPACAGQAPSAIHKICKFEACHCNQGCVAELLEYIMSGKADEDIVSGKI